MFTGVFSAFPPLVSPRFFFFANFSPALYYLNAWNRLLRWFKSLPSPILESIYIYKGMLPSITYGICVWGNCNDAKLASLEKIHLSAAKLIFKQHKSSDSQTRLPSSWKPISQLYKLRLLCLTHKMWPTLHRILMLKVKARAQHAFTLKQKNLF